ncbi:VOC family protein [Nocardiopsis mangrovi]|uniref:VOC family protein n=1 Tax=Nocardiopsis mangrovi TaxID=1179818 RepID=A0ABV9DY94_9ACTN
MALGHLQQIIVNAADSARLARFWAVVLGGTPIDRGDGWSVLEASPLHPQIAFQPDPRPKADRNRLHLDVQVTDIPAATAEAEAAGARRLGDIVTDEEGSFQVLADPEGNEFCLVIPVPQSKA